MAFVADAAAADDVVVVAAAARISFYKLENLALGFDIFFLYFFLHFPSSFRSTSR